jgi:hypothetical protein
LEDFAGPESLSARVLRAVYFPQLNFLDAVVGPNPSRVWRAIEEGKQVLKLGLIRHIGLGESIRIWDMNWLPREGSMRPICSIKNKPPVWVTQLIDQTSRRWGRQILLEFFTPLDIETIENIPLCILL